MKRQKYDFELIPPGNPRIEKTLNSKDRYLALGKLPRIPGLCKWCFKRPNKTFRHQYCSEDCQLSAEIFCYPQGSLSRSYLFQKQNGICAHCPYEFKGNDSEVDHVQPIFKGGTALGSANHQLLCKVCHLKKTIEERKVE